MTKLRAKLILWRNGYCSIHYCPKTITQRRGRNLCKNCISAKDSKQRDKIVEAIDILKG